MTRSSLAALAAVVLALPVSARAAHAPMFVRLSYPLADASTSIGIAWTTLSKDDPSQVEYGPDASYGKTAQAVGFVANWLQSFKDFPPRQKPGSFNLDRVMEAVTKPQAGAN